MRKSSKLAEPDTKPFQFFTGAAKRISILERSKNGTFAPSKESSNQLATGSLPI
jgi:hypothetical protein